MKRNSSIINGVYTKFLTPFLLCFALYVQVFGEVSPGGGFQAGAIIATSLIAYDLSCAKLEQDLTSPLLIRLSSLGILIYMFTGIYSFAAGKNFLDYSVIANNIDARKIGICMVELGVCFTVSMTMIFIYLEIKNAN
ncbi:MAG: MnhB domain-containing protein [Rickettsiaceae bacterium]|nr:MnhB domain-containing protein [Rickettsiaceae bacterium]